MKIYVASSWRNDYQQDVVRALRERGHDVYDFRHPHEGNDGFSWRCVYRFFENWTEEEYLQALQHERACEGYNLDYRAMQEAEACVLVLPCGRSAHLEAGWFVGQEKPLYILLGGKLEPELMYKMAAGIYQDLGVLLIELKSVEGTLDGQD